MATPLVKASGPSLGLKVAHSVTFFFHILLFLKKLPMSVSQLRQIQVLRLRFSLSFLT